MNYDYDVIIIGAGPAGSTCAKILKDNNFKTLIIEKRKLPRIKPCGGLISVRSYKYLKEVFGEIPEKLKCKNSKMRIVISKNGKRFVPTRDSEQIKVYRKDFDMWLVESSKSDIIDNAYYVYHNIKNNCVEVEIIKNNEIKLLTCKYLIGADGGGGKVRKNIDSSSPKYCISKQIVVEGESILNPSDYYFLVNSEYSDLFAWFNVEDHLIYYGSCYLFGNKNNNYLEKLLELLKTNFNLKIKKYIRNEICVGDTRSDDTRYLFGNRNVLLIGEATGLIYRLGEGIPSALISAKYCAESIIQNKINNENVFNCYYNKVIQEKEYSLKVTL